ncbi:MAG TPA: hypothetical protein VMJ64_14835 [Anaerolineales bacterium]|nr:hypothetical protein [Anaerolineales bacterium]
MNEPNLKDCQLPNVPKMAEGDLESRFGSLMLAVKRFLAPPWNSRVKPMLKQAYSTSLDLKAAPQPQSPSRDSVADAPVLARGDLVRVRSREEIIASLDPFGELKGCAFLPQMFDYCGTEQRVFRVMQKFMDERDSKMKRVRGVILLEDLICKGTMAFGECDRACLLFWREEWLEKIPSVEAQADAA